LAINSLTANPSVLRPGDNTVLTVSASDGTGGALTYAWSAASGLLSSPSGNPVTWTAPGAVGSYLVNVTVSNGSGSSAAGAVSILVSVSPSGPIITSVNPSPARIGQTIRITGGGFGAVQGTSTVAVGGVVASAIVSWSDVEIRATVPASAATGDVIATIGGVQSSPFYVIVLWAQGNPLNVAISTAANAVNCQIVSDGAGGAIIAWEDTRSGTSDIYAQRVSAGGLAQWTADGVAISPAANSQRNCQMVSDGAGGAIIAWEDFRSGTTYDIYAQRVSAGGLPQWTAGGVAISTAAGNQQKCQIVSDGAGGAVIGWEDFRSGTTYDIYAQRVSAGGLPQWTADGVAISTAADSQQKCQIASDGAGGAIIAWEDFRSGTTYDIYAQRVSAGGLPQWTADGVAISTAAGHQMTCQIVSDGAGGAIIAWEDLRSGTTFQIVAQRVSAGGLPQWTAGGVAITLAPNDQLTCQMVSDGAGGAIIAWHDFRSGTDFDIVAQRVTAGGLGLWGNYGVPISIAASDQRNCQIVSDGAGGAIIAWEDFRGGTSDIYVQQVSAGGVLQWTADGVPISMAVDDQLKCQIVSDGAGGAIIAWQDRRNGTSYNIYAQGVNAAGQP
jgi:hypothetical protein